MGPERPRAQIYWLGPSYGPKRTRAPGPGYRGHLDLVYMGAPGPGYRGHLGLGIGGTWALHRAECLGPNSTQQGLYVLESQVADLHESRRTP